MPLSFRAVSSIAAAVAVFGAAAPVQVLAQAQAAPASLPYDAPRRRRR